MGKQFAIHIYTDGSLFTGRGFDYYHYVSPYVYLSLYHTQGGTGAILDT